MWYKNWIWNNNFFIRNEEKLRVHLFSNIKKYFFQRTCSALKSDLEATAKL